MTPRAWEGAPLISDLLDRVEALAPLPHVATRVIQLADDDRFSAYDLAAVIATDTALTAKILRLANSAHYGFPRRIRTVRDAVVLIGFRAVRATAIAAAVIDMFPQGESGLFNTDLFWGHSVACALVAEAIAKETGYTRPDEAFTAGVLHDVGRLVLSQYEGERFGQVLYHALSQGVSLEVAERRYFNYDHCEVGAELSERWAFPKDLCAAIGNHHDLSAPAATAGLTHVLAHANALCHRYGLWCGLDSADGAKIYEPHAASARRAEANPALEAVIRRIGGAVGIEERVQDFLRNAHDRQVRWYTPSTTPPPDRDAHEAA